MKKIDVNSSLSLIANIGVVVGIIFLVVEIQQSNRIATASTEIEIRGLFSGINESVYAVSGMAELLKKAQESDAQLAMEETIKLRGYVYRLVNTWQAIEIARDNEVVPGDTFSIVEDDVRAFISRYPATIRIFREIVELYPGQGSRQVIQIIQDALDQERV